MSTSSEARSVTIGEKRSVTVTGIFNERTEFFELKPMFISSQPPTVTTDRTEEIQNNTNHVAWENQSRLGPQASWPDAEREFDTHTLHLVATNELYGRKIFMLPMDIICRDGAVWDGTYVFAGNIPYVPRIDVMDFYRASQHLYRFEIPRSNPQIAFDWHPGRAAPEGEHIVSWQGRHGEGRSLFYYLAYESVNGIREPLNLLSQLNEVEVDFSSLPSGVGRLILTASDGYNTVETYSPRFFVPRRPCTAHIFSPKEGAVLAGGLVDLSGRGMYDDGKTEEIETLEWVSDREGKIGQGALVTGVVLSPGRHQITLIAGLPGAQGTGAVQIEALPTDPDSD